MKQQKTLGAFVGALVLAATLGGCGGNKVSHGILFSSANPLEPTAGDWRTWVVPNPAALRPGEPPRSDSHQTRTELAALEALAAARTSSDQMNIDFWNAGTALRWNEFQRQMVISHSTNPPKASRIYGACAVAMYDAMVVAFDTKYAFLRARPSDVDASITVYGPEPDAPSYVSERAAMSAACASVLRFAFPMAADVSATDALEQTARDADLIACTHFQSDVDAGAAIGNTVGQLVVTRLMADHGDDPQPTYTPSGLPGRWAPTAPAFVPSPLLPGWGNVTPWVLPNGSYFRPGAPPSVGSNEWAAQVIEVFNVNQSLTPERLAIAQFWADGGGTFTPPGHWNQIASTIATAHALNEPRMARMYALLGVAQADAFIACWDCKYAYDTSRPITEIRANIAGQAGWLPPIVTPPFPSYPSGHSTTSGAASQVLGFLFPDMAASIAAMATEAKDSRIFGGIHYSVDNDTGLDLGRQIGGQVIGIAAADGSN